MPLTPPILLHPLCQVLSCTPAATSLETIFYFSVQVFFMFLDQLHSPREHFSKYLFSFPIIYIWKCLNVHTVCTNFGLNIHTVCTNFGLDVHTVCTNFGLNVHIPVYKIKIRKSMCTLKRASEKAPEWSSMT